MRNTIIISTLATLLLMASEAGAVTIPAGSYVQGELAQTLNVSVSDKSGAAALIHLTGKINTAGDLAVTLIHCDIYGKAVANQDSERVLITPQVLLCYDNKGHFSTTPVSGQVADQKGAQGLSAEFITFPTQEVATVNAGIPVSVIFTNSFRLNQ